MGKGESGKARVVGRWALGVQEASAVAPLGEGRFLVVDDEAGIFRCAIASDPVALEAGAGLSDLEGICVGARGRSAFVLAERDGSVWRYALEDDALHAGDRLGRLSRIGKKKNAGWEGIAFHPERGELVAVHQAKPRRVGFFDVESLEERATLRLPKAARKALDDLNDVTVHPRSGHLLVLSGKENAIAELAVEGEELELVCVYTLDADEGDIPEGITFDDEGRLFVCTDGEGWLFEVVLEE